MESEMDTDVSDVKPKASAAKKSVQKTERAEDVPVNWARKAHTSDRIPVPSVANMEFNEDHTRLILEDQTSYGENDFVFVTPASRNPSRHRDDINYQLPSAFRIARIMSFEETGDEVLAKVNWFQRPAIVEKHPENSRELYVTFNTGLCKINDFRGKCTVCNKLEVRNLARYCDKPTQFWFSHLYDPVTTRLYDVLPVSSLKSFTPDILERIGRSVSSVVVDREQTKKLCEPHRKRKQSQLSHPSTESEPEPQDAANKNEWPFRYFQAAGMTVSQDPGLPNPSIDTENGIPTNEKHVDVPDWPGKPLVYYTMAAHNPASGKSQKLRLLEAQGDEDIWEVNTSLPWVQQMPKGYIARGTDVTATELSLPLPEIDAFVRACQENYAANLDVDPHNLNFVDACCRAYTTNGGDENKALVEVSRFTRRSIGEPELTAAEASSFEKAMNPFSGNSWHDVFRAVKTKPIADLSQYFWTQRPDTAITSVENQYWANDPESEADDIQCAICLTEETNEWKKLPGYVPIPVTDSPAKKALCSRCARLWYRYQVNWLPFPRVEELENEGAHVESELLEDAKAVKAEDERRRKRKAVAQEKKEALERKRQEAKQAKAEAKAAGKSIKAPARKKLKQEAPEPEKVDLIETDETDTSVVRESHPPESETDTQPETKSGEKSDAKTDTANEPQEESETGSMTQTTTRRRPNTTQLTLNSIDDDFLNALTEDMPPELGSVPQNCVVCGQIDLSMMLQTCASCGLKVHLLCYGPGRYDGQGPWLCDCCVNGRSGLGMDSFYQCAVCPPKQPTYVRWLNGDPVGGTDVLKGTVDKTWCHLRCAVWIQDISFLNPAGLDGIDLGESYRQNEKEKCTICMKRIMIEQQQQQRNDTTANGNHSSNKATGTSSTSETTKALANSGICVTCDICHEAFHVSCAAEETYTFGFIKPTNGTNGRRPVIRCRHHGNSHPDLEPMSYLDLAKGTTVMQEYVENHKKSKREGTITAAERANISAHDELSLIARGLAADSTLVVGSTGLLVGSKSLKCSECHTENAPYWLSTNIGYVCPLCYRGKHWQPTSVSEPDISAAHQEVVKLVDLLFTGGENHNQKAGVS